MRIIRRNNINHRPPPFNQSTPYDAGNYQPPPPPYQGTPQGYTPPAAPYGDTSGYAGGYTPPPPTYQMAEQPPQQNPYGGTSNYQTGQQSGASAPVDHTSSVQVQQDARLPEGYSYQRQVIPSTVLSNISCQQF